MIGDRLQKLGGGVASPRREKWLVGGTLSLLAAVMLLVLLLPGATYIGNYIHDILIFYDGADRIIDGQVPNRDFHTPLGPLAFLLPALGLSLTGTAGGMFPAATAIFTAMLLPLLVYVCLSRLPPLYAIGFGAFVLLITVAPLNVGDRFDSTSYAMFYNRFGWVLLSCLVLFGLPRKPGLGSRLLDLLVVGALLLAMFYLKISYAAVGIVFTIGLIFLSPLKRTAAGALLFFAAAVMAVELLWNGTGAYIADIRRAGAVSGALGGGATSIFLEVLENIAGCFLFFLLLCLAFLRGVEWRTFLLILYIGAAGLLIINQNAQAAGIITFLPAGILCCLAPVKNEKREREWIWAAAPLLLAVFAVPLATMSAIALLYQSMMSAKTGGEGLYEANFDGLSAREGHLETTEPPLDALRAAYRSGVADIAMLHVARSAALRQTLGQAEYLQTVGDGVELLRSASPEGGAIFVFDMANPFNAALGRNSPTGIDAWNHLGRTFTKNVHRPAEVMFRNVELVMDPKAPANLGTKKGLQEVYGSYVSTHFKKVGESTYWRLWKRVR